MKMRFFDFEVFPNWWCVTFGDWPDSDKLDESIKDTFDVITSDDERARDKVLAKMKEPGIVNVGYNIKGYDLAIANAIYQGFECKDVKIVNDIIINPGCAWETKDHIRLQSFAKKKLGGIVYQDLFDDSQGSLKEKEAILGLNILESNVPFDKQDLTQEDKDDVIYYNKHDVYASMVWYDKVMRTYVSTKLTMGIKFNIPENECYTCTNARLIAKALGARRVSFDDADKVEIFLPDKINKYCYDNLPSNVLDTIRNQQGSYSVKLFDNKVDFGNGGIHSVYSTNIYLESDDEWVLLNKDAASYYPSMLIQFDCLSRAVHDKNIFIDIYHERLALKHKKDKTQQDEMFQLADKLVLNTTFGASGNKYIDLYDPYMCTRCCRVGQIFLAALANKLVTNVPGLKVIQTNTDGILLYVKRKYLPLVTELGEEWSAISGIQMEDDEIQKIWQRDVNNYLLVKTNGKSKNKGSWLVDTWENPGYFFIKPLSAFVSQKAAAQFLLTGRDIVDTIVENTNLVDYLMTCKKGPTYSKVVQKFEDGHEEELFKCNRIIATKDTSKGMLYKIKMYKGKASYTKMPSIPEHCQLMNNDIGTYDFAEIRKNLDYMFYVQRAVNALDIPWVQIVGDDSYQTHRFDYE